MLPPPQTEAAYGDATAAYEAPFVRPAPSSNTGVVILVVAVVAFVGVAIVGVVAGLGYYGTRRYAGQAKVLEGKVHVQRLAVHAELCGDFGSTLPPSAGPVPAKLSSVAGTTYVATNAEWALFDCRTTSARYAPPTRFDISEPTYFQYSWERQTPTSGVARARADLDGDGVVDVTFELPVTCTAGHCTHALEPTEIRPE
jgi:hypothetical protein